MAQANVTAQEAPGNNAVQKYLDENPFTKPVPAEDQELFCLCMQPEDGKPKIECANGPECFLRWYHVECIGLTEETLPDEDGKILTRLHLLY